MRRITTDGAVALGATLCILAAGGSRVEAGKPVELRLAPPAGKALHYQLENQSDINYQGSEMTALASGRLTMTRQADAANGNLVFEVVVDKLEASRRQGDNLQEQPLGLDGTKVQAEITPRGSLVKIVPAGDLDAQKRKLLDNLVDGLFFQLPEKTVVEGGTWKANLDRPDGSRTGSGEFTLDEVTKKSGLEVAKVSGPVTTTTTEPPLSGKGDIEAAIALDGGYIVTEKGSMDLQGEDGGPSIEQSFEIKLVE